MLSLSQTHQIKPLDSITISGHAAGRIQVRDGEGRVYVDEAAATNLSIVVGGALGAHVVFALDDNGQTVETATFHVSCKTEIEDAGGRFQRLLGLLHDTMFNDWHSGYRKGLRIDGKFYYYYVSWIRDHVHCLKGYKYFDADTQGMQSGIELYADSQREDGMIYDKCKEMAHSELQFWRDHEFSEGDFIKKVPGNPTRRWQRVPVENDVEYLWIEGLYYTWKATGDNNWMSKYLDNALKAVGYSTSDRYRWSEKLKLLKRGYTIDTWDFQHKEDIARSGSSMRVDPDKTIFGVMFGDNTGMAVSCAYLAEMLRVAGRDEDAQNMQDLSDQLTERINKLAWNGKFFTHHISEDPSVKRECGGTDESAQIVQSNAYSLNRRIGQDKCAEIVKSYQGIREVMPETSAGEFYSCYPPYEKGFKNPKWEYMNGGVTTICGGELAHGALENGFEEYGSDILLRLLDWSEKLDGYLHTCLKGKLPEQPKANYTSIDISELANISFNGDAKSVPGWTGDPENDMRNIPRGLNDFEGVAFNVLDGERACIGLAHQEGYSTSVTVPVNAKTRSIYFLHGLAGGANPVGSMVFHYKYGSHKTQYIRSGQEINSWFMPPPNSAFVGGNGKGKQPKNLRLGWQGGNGTFENVGMYVYGWENPQPDNELSHIEIECAEHNAQWMLAGVSLSDQPVVFPGNPVSYGIPDMWGSAAVVYALIEGLAGIVDDGVRFDRVKLNPRWESAGVDEATASAVYPNSNGYCRYHYKKSANSLSISVTGNGENMQCGILLPNGSSAASLSINGNESAVNVSTVESSQYVNIDLNGVGVHEIAIALK